MRLQKFLADAGLGSRRKCETLIAEGRVRVNGEPAVIGQSVDPKNDSVVCDGKKLEPAAAGEYILLYKPVGYLSTVSDPFSRGTVLDLVKSGKRLYPVGRLDKNSEGLMLLTNDGDLAYRLTHPKFQIEKVYEVWVSGVPSPRTLKKVENGILLEDGMTSPCKSRLLKISGGKDKSLIELTLHEGRKREIRRMMKTVGHPVVSLRRVSIGPLRLAGLSPGECRPLTKSELENLKKRVGK